MIDFVQNSDKFIDMYNDSYLGKNCPCTQPGVQQSATAATTNQPCSLQIIRHFENIKQSDTVTTTTQPCSLQIIRDFKKIRRVTKQ